MELYGWQCLCVREGIWKKTKFEAEFMVGRDVDHEFKFEQFEFWVPVEQASGKPKEMVGNISLEVEE